MAISPDDTHVILKKWCTDNEDKYKKIIFNSWDTSNVPLPDGIWTPQRFKIPGYIRNKSLQAAKEHNCDYYFLIDCDNFLNPSTLKELMSKDKPIIAPMLDTFPETLDISSNYFCDVTANGEYKHHPDYLKIYNRSDVGTFKVPLVLGTYLIKSQYLKMNYLDDTYDHDYIVFARSCRNLHIDQYICNEKAFGKMIHFYEYLTKEQEKSLSDFLVSHQ